MFFSMATSSGDDMPRNLEFLFSRNRLNVAISRARCLAVVVASPEAAARALPHGGADAAGECVVPLGRDCGSASSLSPMNELSSENEIHKVKCDCCGEEFPEEELIYGVCAACDAMINDEGSW